MSLVGKVLVVDDEEVTRQSLADILKLEGCQVCTAADGATALDWLQQEPFDLILLDLKMPGMDGLEVMRRATKISPDTQIVLLTAHGSLESAIEALRQGASDYLLKPASPGQVIHSVGRGLEHHAETRRKRQLIAQLEASLSQLKNVSEAAASGEAKQAAENILIIGGGVYADTARREIWDGKRRVSLTPAEARLIQVLVQNPGKVFSHRELVQRVQGYETTDWEAPGILRPLVSRLRRKLTQFAGGECWIASVRGSGYVFQPPKKG